MNVVMIIPTGIGCEIGGHAGDANPYAKLLSSCCDNLIIHPNVVNASDINEMTENMWYTEGSILDRFLRGEIFIQRPYYNKILLAVNNPIDNDTINAANAAKATIGADIEVVELDTPLTMTGYYDENRKATGHVTGWLELVDQLQEYDFDALGLQTLIDIDIQTKLDYLKYGGVNPWGGVEAIASRLVAEKLDKPVAHAPYVNWKEESQDLVGFDQVVDHRMAAEMVSLCYIHCVFKGLHRAPRIDYEKGMSVDDVDFLITPIDCYGPPHQACEENDVCIIAVEENTNVCGGVTPNGAIRAKTYLEAVGLLQSYKAGVVLPGTR